MEPEGGKAVNGLCPEGGRYNVDRHYTGSERSGVAIKDTMSASGYGIMRCRKVKIGWAATRFLYRRK